MEKKKVSSLNTLAAILHPQSWDHMNLMSTSDWLMLQYSITVSAVSISLDCVKPAQSVCVCVCLQTRAGRAAESGDVHVFE